MYAKATFCMQNVISNSRVLHTLSALYVYVSVDVYDFACVIQRVCICRCGEFGALHQVCESDACYVWIPGFARSFCE